MPRSPVPLGEYVDQKPTGRAYPPCCQIPREVMSQIEENFRRPKDQQKSYAACSRWLAFGGYKIPPMNLRNHINGNHAERFSG
jgi:hypothetical protein